jgi:acetyltransferase-like isoleucine patch superfamily enzyme
VLSKVFWTVKRYGVAVGGFVQRKRLAWFLFSLRLRAIWMRTRLELDVAPDVVIGRGIRVILKPQSPAKLVIGAGVRIEDGVRILLHSGELRIGAKSWLRANCLLNVWGTFVMGPENIVSWYSTIHCGESVTFGSQVGLAERVTVADSMHYFTEPETFFYHNTRHAPVVVGDNTWLAPGVTVTHGTQVGSHCILGAGAVVSGHVPDGHLVAGTAASTRELRLPWKTSAHSNGARPRSATAAQPCQ